MSYLNTPRLHFAGNFQADPSTVNNNDANFDSTVQFSNQPPNPADLNNTSVYWNPNGTHNWKLANCTVRGAATDTGAFDDPSQDPIIGASVASVGTFPAKIVDLDPDNQSVSQIWGLTILVSIADPADPSKVLASVRGTLPPTAFGDLWNRGMNTSRIGMGTMSAVFQGRLQNLQWQTAEKSPLLQKLQTVSPNELSIRFIVDSFQSDSNQANFTYGRVVGTIGPVLAGEAPRSTPRRLAPVTFWSQPPFIDPNLSSTPTIFSAYGAAGAAWDAGRGVLILDLGNCMPTNAATPSSGPSVPTTGWPIISAQLQLTIPGAAPSSPARLKLGAPSSAPQPVQLGTISFDTSTYLTYAGIVEVPVPAALQTSVNSSPLTLTVTAGAKSGVAVQEDPQGRYADVDLPFVRMNPGDTATITLWATKFGQPWASAQLPVFSAPRVGDVKQPASDPGERAANGGPWPNAYPEDALTLSTAVVTTGPDGTGTLVLTAKDPGTPRTYPDGEPGPDGQVYWVTGEWAGWGDIFLFAAAPTTAPLGVPINILVFSSYPMPDNPNWDDHVEPILGNYARMFPYMRSIIDIGDYDTVVQNADGIQYVLSLPVTNPHHMPIVRDLSADKLKMILKWFQNGMPKSATSTKPATAAASAT